MILMLWLKKWYSTVSDFIMKHFLDLGTHRFQGLEYFTQKLGIDSSWNVYCFEPNGEIYEEALVIKPTIEGKYKSLSFKKEAIMDHNGTLTFYSRNSSKCHLETADPVVKNYGSQGSCALGKLEKGHYHPQHGQVEFIFTEEVVPCIDINGLLDDICSSDPEAIIYIKMDIEGSEFVALPRFIESPHTSKVKEMYVEWHERFWRDEPQGQQKKMTERAYLTKKIKDLGIKIHTHI